MDEEQRSVRARPVGGLMMLLVTGALLVCLPWLAYLLARPTHGPIIDSQGRQIQEVFEGETAVLVLAIVGSIVGGGCLLAFMACFAIWFANVHDDMRWMTENAELPASSTAVALLFVPVFGPVWAHVCMNRLTSLAQRVYYEHVGRRRTVRGPNNPVLWLFPATALGVLYPILTVVLAFMARSDPTLTPTASLAWFALPLVISILVAGSIASVKRNLDFAIGQWRRRPKTEPALASQART